MAVSSLTTRTSYAGDGSTNPLPIPWIFWSPTDITVYSISATGAATLWTLGSQYTITGGAGSTGNVVPTSGTTVFTSTLILLKPVETHLTSYVPNEPFPSEVIQEDFDRLTQMAQYLNALSSYALSVPYTDGSAPTGLPAAATRANNFLAFDGSGNPQMSPGVSGVALTQGNVGLALYPQTAAELAASVTPTNYGYAPGDVRRYGADPTGVADSTTAINNAILVALAATHGGDVIFGPGDYSVTEINATRATADFTRTVRIMGAGRLVTRIVARSAGTVLLNMMGANNMFVEDLTFYSGVGSQCAIYMARTTTSGNCNNNKFRSVFTEGSYSVASVVCNGSESSNWFNCRFENTNSTQGYCCFRTGGQTGVGALQGVTPVNGGTLLDSGNPNTDNKMFGVEFYAPFTSATPVWFDYAAGYSFYGCTIICGSSNNCRLVTYRAYQAGSNTFGGPVSWYGCHFEVFGSGNAVHWLNGNNVAVSYFNGINNYGGIIQAGTSNVIGVVDYDRTNKDEQPYFRGATWTTPASSPGSSAKHFFYVTGLYSSNITFKTNESDGVVVVSGFAQSSSIDAWSYLGGATRFVLGTHTSTATAVPTTGTYTVGETIQRETPVVGQPTGWKCTVAGTLGTLNGGTTTGTIANSSNVLTLSSATGAAEGQRILIATVGGGPFYIRKLVGTTAYLDAVAVGAGAGVAISFSNATLVALANL